MFSMSPPMMEGISKADLITHSIIHFEVDLLTECKFVRGYNKFYYMYVGRSFRQKLKLYIYIEHYNQGSDIYVIVALLKGRLHNQKRANNCSNIGKIFGNQINKQLFNTM